AGIVVISSWRLLPITLDWFDRLFDGRILGATEEADEDMPRRTARETESDRALWTFAPTTPFAILDDTPAHYEVLNAHLVLPAPTLGVTADDAAQVRAFAARP
ncbi:MAG: HAD domain-containing protein, partial [Pseudomonadales bacterium]|nr:HAD domain-containing protein [Pseudomonadales bacterium]